MLQTHHFPPLIVMTLTSLHWTLTSLDTYIIGHLPTSLDTYIGHWTLTSLDTYIGHWTLTSLDTFITSLQMLTSFPSADCDQLCEVMLQLTENLTPADSPADIAITNKILSCLQGLSIVTSNWLHMCYSRENDNISMKCMLFSFGGDVYNNFICVNFCVIFLFIFFYFFFLQFAGKNALKFPHPTTTPCSANWRKLCRAEGLPRGLFGRK